MNTNNIEVNTQSSIKIVLDKTLYFDPFQIEDNFKDADIIFITHNHYDHFDIESINKVKNEKTIVVAPKSMKDDIDVIDFKEYIYLEPNEETSIDNISIKSIPAYNNDKQFHPRNNNWLGYIVSYNNVTYYIPGDTDKTKESESVKCDIAFVPIGGHFTMDVDEATELIKTINPKIVIPIHYGTIIGNINDGNRLKDSLKNTSIEVVNKLYKE